MSPSLLCYKAFSTNNAVMEIPWLKVQQELNDYKRNPQQEE